MAGVTNNLIDLVRTTSQTPPYSEYDVVLSTGEQVTSALLATALNNLNIKARSWLGWQVPIISDNSYGKAVIEEVKTDNICLLYTSPSPRDKRQSRMPSSA